MYKAASSFNYAKDYTKALELSDEIIANYAESDYFEKATELMINSRIREAMSLKEEKDYKNAIVEFLKILDLKKETQDKYGYTINYQTKAFFQISRFI